MNFPVVWSYFVDFFEKQGDSHILVQILKKTTLLEIVDGRAQVACDNLGMKLLLENKKADIDRLLSQWAGETIETLFLVKERKRQKNTAIVEEAPLLKYETNKSQLLKKAGLQTKYTFDNFAVSPSNQIAYSAGQKVAETPGILYNPLFIYGPVGVGKTHLMQAVANTIIDRNTKGEILYCSSEEFTNELIESIKSKDTASFRKKYRNLDVLLIDDVQFIAGKIYVQEEFYHTFNTIIKNGGQIIITSEKPPKQINKLEERLQSRFSGGLTIDIQEPDFELRTAITLIKARERNIVIDIEAAKIIAEYIDDTRELEGKLLEIYTKTIKDNNEITPLIIKEKLNKEQEKTRNKISHNDVIKFICSYYNITQSAIKSPNRKENIALPRQIIMYILRVVLKLKYDEISLILKRKDHTTIIHGVTKVTNLYMRDPKFKEEVDRIIKSINY